MNVTIMQGIPGSGKSTLAQNMLGEARDTDCHAFIVSADDYFTNRLGEYTFDPKLLPAAHAACLRDFITCVRDWHVDHVIVDNTNTRIEEIAPYYAIAEAYGHAVRILRVVCDPHTALTRGIHNVPARTVQEMANRIEGTNYPSRWKFEVA
jgi:tRNA uridine 5-carbamoylmethylation protein Kti12